MHHNYGWKRLMDSTTDSRTYAIARRNYLALYDEYKCRPYVEYSTKTFYPYIRGRKKRKWTHRRTVSSLPPPIPSNTFVLVKNPWDHRSFCYPTGRYDYSDNDIVGVVRGLRPPREDYDAYNYSDYSQKRPRTMGKVFTRERRYIVVPLVGGSKGRQLLYKESDLKVLTPEEMKHHLFVCQIRELRGEL